MVSLAVSIQYTNVTDRETDGRTDGHRTTAKTALCIASRGNERISLLLQTYSVHLQIH